MSSGETIAGLGINMTRFARLLRGEARVVEWSGERTRLVMRWRPRHRELSLFLDLASVFGEGPNHTRGRVRSQISPSQFHPVDVRQLTPIILLLARP